MKIQSNFSFLAWLSIFLIILSPQLFSEGMFMDGVYYATIARNLSEGIGTFWIPALSDTLGAKFYEHPPLGFGLQSLFFTLFGDHFWVERLYSLGTYVITALIMLRFWSLLAKKKYWHWGVFSLFLWITIPKIIWGASSNLLENTSMIFILLAIYLQLKAFLKESNWPLLLAGFFIFLAFLTKGVTALFPLSFPFFYRLSQKQFKSGFKDYFILLSSLALLSAALFILQPISAESIRHYFEIQVMGSLENPPADASRFYIINRFFQEIAVILGISFLIIVVYRWRQGSIPKPGISPYFWPLLLCALSGILPIMLSLKQSTFYIIPTFPLICLGFSLWLVPRLDHLLRDRISRESAATSWLLFSYILLPVAIISNYYAFGTTVRDSKLVHDVKTIKKIIPERSTIQIHPSMREQYAYYAYFYRYAKISLSTSPADYYIRPIEINETAADRKPVDQLELKQLALFENERIIGLVK